MKTKRILAALRKCKVALEQEATVQILHVHKYATTERYDQTREALTEAESVLADWQVETLKKSEAFR